MENQCFLQVRKSSIKICKISCKYCRLELRFSDKSKLFSFLVLSFFCLDYPFSIIIASIPAIPLKNIHHGAPPNLEIAPKHKKRQPLNSERRSFPSIAGYSFFFFFFLVFIYSPRGLGPIMDSSYLYVIYLRPQCLSFAPELPHASCEARP